MPRLKFKKSFTEINILAHKRLKQQKGEEPNYARFSETLEDYSEINHDVLSVLKQLEQEGVCKVLYTQDAIFKDSDTFYAIDRNNQAQYLSDATHLSPAGCIMLMERLKGEVMRILKAQ